MEDSALNNAEYCPTPCIPHQVDTLSIPMIIEMAPLHRI